MKKLYLFGDSFSLMNDGVIIQTGISNYIENNSHSSLSNDHILKLAKLKLVKLIENGIKDVNILIQLTVPDRMLVIYNENFKKSISNPSNLKYDSSIPQYQDSEIFEEKMYCTLYPFIGGYEDSLIKNVYIPYTTFIVNNNLKNLLKDWILELKILSLLAKENNINLEYFFYTNNYDFHLKNDSLNSSHIKFGDFNSMETFLNSSDKSNYFVSKLDKHFNDMGNLWYGMFLKERYGI